MSDAHGVARDQLRSFIERIERLESEKKTIADDIKDVYGEAKGTGFDTKILRKVIQIRKQDRDERAEQEAILDSYLAALGMLLQPDFFEDEPRQSAPAESRSAVALRSDAGLSIVTKHTEITASPVDTAVTTGDDLREPVAAEQGQIIREGDAPRETDRFGGDASCPDTEFSQAETTAQTHERPSINDEPSPEAGPQAEASPAGTGTGMLADREGRSNGEAVSADLPTISEKATVATQGEATAPTSDERETDLDEAAEGDRDGANEGGIDVDRSGSPATHLVTGEGTALSALPDKPRASYRPNCLKPGSCASGTRDHCYACRKAMEREDAA